MNRVHLLSYEIPLQTGVTADVVGKFNHDNFARSLPETKNVISGVLKNGDHTFSTFVRMVSDYETTRALDDMAKSMGFSQYMVLMLLLVLLTIYLEKILLVLK